MKKYAEKIAEHFKTNPNATSVLVTEDGHLFNAEDRASISAAKDYARSKNLELTEVKNKKEVETPESKKMATVAIKKANKKAEEETAKEAEKTEEEEEAKKAEEETQS